MVVIIRWLVLIFCLYLINDKCLLLIAGSVVYVSDCYNVSNTDYNDHWNNKIKNLQKLYHVGILTTINKTIVVVELSWIVSGTK
jgi:hypothetical protein